MNIINTVIASVNKYSTEFTLQKTKKEVVALLFGNKNKKNKIIKIEVLGLDNSVIASAEKGFVFPDNLDSDEDSILMIKGKKLPELEKGVKVVVITTAKSGDRVKYPGDVVMSHDRQMNVVLAASGSGGPLQERRRYFKIKVDLHGRALFYVRDEDAVRFEVPPSIDVNDINVGGIFMKCQEYEFESDDCVCVEIELLDGYLLNTMARILRVQRKDEVILGYGCAFENLTAAQEDAIGKYINQEQLIQRARMNDFDDEDI